MAADSTIADSVYSSCGHDDAYRPSHLTIGNSQLSAGYSKELVISQAAIAAATLERRETPADGSPVRHQRFVSAFHELSTALPDGRNRGVEGAACENFCTVDPALWRETFDLVNSLSATDG